MTFQDKLKQLMAATDPQLIEAALAQRSGVSYSTIHGYVNGRRAPSFENVVKLARALGVELTVFADCEFRYQSQPAKSTGPPNAPARRRTGRKMSAHPRLRPRKSDNRP